MKVDRYWRKGVTLGAAEESTNTRVVASLHAADDDKRASLMITHPARIQRRRTISASRATATHSCAAKFSIA